MQLKKNDFPSVSRKLIKKWDHMVARRVQKIQEMLNSNINLGTKKIMAFKQTFNY